MKLLRRVAACAALINVFAYCQALTLTEALQKALQSDPQFLTAQANLEAARERSNQAFGALLPQASFTANTAGNKREYEVLGSQPFTVRDNYNSNGQQIQVTQPLWRRASQIANEQANDSVLQAEYQLANAGQDLLNRLAQAWFDVMTARDAANFYSAQLAAAKQQMDQSKRGMELGLASGPILEEARAKHDQALADYGNAESEKHIKIAALEQIIGPLNEHNPPALADDFEINNLQAMPLEQWLGQAETKNPAILAALYAVEAANKEIKKQRAGHQPTLDAVVTYSRNEQSVGSFPGQSGSDIRHGSVALQLNIPIFSGGAQNAKVREAIAMRDKAKHELESARRNVRTLAKQAWFTWQAANIRYTSSSQAEKSATTNLQAAIKGKSLGAKIELDILQARQQLSLALREKRRARYDMLTSQFKLHSVLGNLTEKDLMSLDAWLINAGNSAEGNFMKAN